MQNKILVVDDNQEIREVIRVLLGSEGYEIMEASNGSDAIALAKQADLIILDIMMPQTDGFQACIRIREFSNAPILFLSAKGLDQDKALGFSSGGDDYLTKPFSYNELLARVKALLRRYQVYKGKRQEVEEPVLQRQDLKLDTNTHVVYQNGKLVNLTDLEYQILYLLMKYPHKIYSIQNLYESIWKEPYFYTANNTVMVHIRNLRKKLEVDSDAPSYIKTVWGKGYRFE